MIGRLNFHRVVSSVGINGTVNRTERQKTDFRKIRSGSIRTDNCYNNAKINNMYCIIISRKEVGFFHV